MVLRLRGQLLVREQPTDRRADVAVERIVAGAVIDKEKTARVQMAAQAVDLLVAEFRIAEAGHVQERERSYLGLDRINVLQVEADRQRRLVGQVAEQLNAAVRIGVLCARVSGRLAS